MTDEPKLIVNGREYAMPESFTMGELADMEKITGQGYDLEAGGVLGTLALVFVAIRRTDPRVTVDDIRNLGPDDVGIKGVPDLPPVLSGNGTSPLAPAPPSTKTSGKGSEPTPAKTPARTGTES
jgi:hypothetical protein